MLFRHLHIAQVENFAFMLTGMPFIQIFRRFTSLREIHRYLIDCFKCLHRSSVEAVDESRSVQTRSPFLMVGSPTANGKSIVNVPSAIP